MSPEPQLTGMAKTFNSVTFTGRANVAKATYAGEPMCKCYNVSIILFLKSNGVLKSMK